MLVEWAQPWSGREWALSLPPSEEEEAASRNRKTETREQMHQDEITVTLPRSKKVEARWMLAIPPASVVVVSLFAPLRLPHGTGLEDLNAWSSFGGLALFYTFAACYFVYILMRIKSTGWFQAEFTISPEYIKVKLRDGNETKQYWADLEYFSPRRLRSHFKDGTRIELAFGPWIKLKFTDETMDELLATLGPESVVTRACREYASAAPSRNKLIVHSVLTMCGIAVMAIIFIPLWPDHPVLAVLFALSCVALNYLFAKRRSQAQDRVERKYCPPRRLRQ